MIYFVFKKNIYNYYKIKDGAVGEQGVRKVAVLSEGDGKILVRYLQAQGIEVELRAEASEANVELWVVDEEHCEAVREMVAEFRQDPYAAKYRQVSSLPKAKKTKRVRYVDVRTQVFHRAGVQGKLTAALIGISLLIFLVQSFGIAPRLVAALYISRYVQPMFVEIQQGEVWRLLTPIFLHFGILHFVFNMLWLYSLGTQVELRGSWQQLIALVIGVGVVSNLGQYVLVGPLFGGFSGVVYGLLGYVWIMAQFAPSSGYVMDRFTVGFMLVWLLLGMSGVLGSIANAAHLFGLASGVLWGLYVARVRRRL